MIAEGIECGFNALISEPWLLLHICNKV